MTESQSIKNLNENQQAYDALYGSEFVNLAFLRKAYKELFDF